MSTPPAAATGEAAALRGALQGARRHVTGILADLPEPAWHRPALPSRWTPAQLVSHLTHDVERFWFGAVVAGDPDVAAALPPDAWQAGDGASPADLLAAYRAAGERADEVLAGLAPDTAPAWWPEDLFGSWRLPDVRAVVLHVVVETATHAGHLDAARELADGRQWMVLDDGRP